MVFQNFKLMSLFSEAALIKRLRLVLCDTRVEALINEISVSPYFMYFDTIRLNEIISHADFDKSAITRGYFGTMPVSF